MVRSRVRDFRATIRVRVRVGFRSWVEYIYISRGVYSVR